MAARKTKAKTNKKKTGVRGGGRKPASKRRGTKKQPISLLARIITSLLSIAGFVARAAVVFVAVTVVWVLAYRFINPPTTWLMMTEGWGGQRIIQHNVPLEAVAPTLYHSIIGAEDSGFCSHMGFDLEAIDKALKDADNGARLRGASTLTQQTAKNAFLWPGRNFIRKGLEAYFTVLMEALWPKRRIMEIYLNVVEFGPGVFGAEAAARSMFKKPARNLNAHEAALLAAVLPNPKQMRAEVPSAYVRSRANTLEKRARVVKNEGLAHCVLQ